MEKTGSYYGMDMLEAKLVVVGGAPEGDEFPLVLPCTLGRAREATVPLPHPLVSRKHCELFERNGHLFVRDLGSTNGTFVGSERVEESVLAHGDLLTVGTVTLRTNFQHIPVTTPPERDSRLVPAKPKFPNDDTAAIARIDTDVEIQIQKPTRRKQKAK